MWGNLSSVCGFPNFGHNRKGQPHRTYKTYSNLSKETKKAGRGEENQVAIQTIFLNFPILGGRHHFIKKIKCVDFNDLAICFLHT